MNTLSKILRRLFGQQQQIATTEDVWIYAGVSLGYLRPTHIFWTKRNTLCGQTWLSDAKWLPRSIYPYTIDGVCYDFAEDGWPTVNGQRGNIVEL